MRPPRPTRLDRGRAWLGCGLALLVALGGCARPPADPLQLKVEAQHPQQLTRWNRRHLPRLPEELRQEYLTALQRIDRATGHPRRPGERPTKDPFDPLCRRVHERTVRDVILDGYAARLETLEHKLARESRNLVANIGRFEEATDVASYERFVVYQQNVLERYEEAKAATMRDREAFLAQTK